MQSFCDGILSGLKQYHLSMLRRIITFLDLVDKSKVEGTVDEKNMVRERLRWCILTVQCKALETNVISLVTCRISYVLNLDPSKYESS